MSARRVVALALLVLAASVAPAVAQQTRTPPLGSVELLAALRGGGLIIYIRDADTDYRQQDMRPLNLADCPAALGSRWWRAWASRSGAS